MYKGVKKKKEGRKLMGFENDENKSSKKRKRKEGKKKI